MAKKTKKPTTLYDRLSSIYSAEVIDKMTIIQGRFESEMKQHIFHFDLMNNRVKYFTYDGNDKTCMVILPKDDEESINKVNDIMSLNNVSPSIINPKITILQ